MALSSKGAALGTGGVLLALVLVAPVALARTGATATPVPFPQAPRVPDEAQMRALLADREAFLRQVDEYIGAVHATTESYRQYVARVKEMLASCEVEADLEGFKGTEFEGLVNSGLVLCRGWVADFDRQARRYAAQLDEAIAYQKLVQKVGSHVQGQIDRIQIMLHARQLHEEVDRGLGRIKESRRAISSGMKR